MPVNRRDSDFLPKRRPEAKAMRSDRNIKRSAANSTKNRRTGSYIPPAQQRPAQPGASSRSAHYDWSVKTTGEVFSNGSSIELLRESSQRA